MQPTIQYINAELSALYPTTEVQAFTRLILENICGWSFTEQILNKNERISTENFRKIESIVSRLKQFEPLQYILGETEFFGLKLNVNPSVLIPRPETEELVEWICRQNLPKNAAILDIGTGSGCIALALKSHFKSAKVSAFDISETALETALQNAIRNQLEVDFFAADILNWQSREWPNFDLIVSNPPYVRELERQAMNANVVDFEPEPALFVPNENPLLFYRFIAAFAQKYLNENGKLFLEINEYLGNEMRDLLESYAFKNIEIRNDLNGKMRMAACNK